MTFNNPSKVNFTYINKLMEEIHDHSDEIYESLADQDYNLGSQHYLLDSTTQTNPIKLPG